MIDLTELRDLMPLITGYLTTDDIRFKTYATTKKDPEFFKILYGDYYEWHINKIKRDLTFNEYVDILTFVIIHYTLNINITMFIKYIYVD